MKHFFLIVFFIGIMNLSAQEWTNISPFPASGLKINGNFISEEEGWVSQGGSLVTDQVYHTEDGGESWEIVYSLEDSQEFFISLQMTDNQNGWATKRYNNDTSYLKTTDGGYSWEDMTEYMPYLNDISQCYFINHDIGFSEGYDSLTLANQIYKTIDGGYNWHLTETPTLYDPYSNLINYSVNKFFFLDENNGWAACSAFMGAGLSLSTSDGGESWEVGICVGGPDLFDIHFINPDYGGAVGYSWGGYVYITENNFQTILYSHADMHGLETICFQNDSTIWITGTSGTIYRSTDGGATFETFQVTDASFHKIQFFGNTGYIFGMQNALLKFVDPASAEEPELSIAGYQLANFPNPFSSETTISFSLTTNLHEKARIEIFNIKGQLVENLQITNSPNQQIIWNADNHASGVYFYKLVVDGIAVDTKKMILLK